MKDLMEKFNDWKETADRRKLLMGGGVLISVFLVIAVALNLFVGGEDEEEAGEGGLVEEPMLPASYVYDAVQATVEAYVPTAIPTATPNVPATVQAELALNRREVGSVVVLNPLDSEKPRNPYLRSADLEYFEELGPFLWRGVKVWALVDEFMRTDWKYWNAEDMEVFLGGVFEHRLGDSMAEFEGSSERDDLGDAVRSYGSDLEGALVLLESAVDKLVEGQELLVVVESSGTAVEIEARLQVIEGEVDDALRHYNLVMEAYGCSICGELFRSEVLE